MIAKEPGRSRRAEKDGSARYDARQASFRAAHHASRAPRWRTRNSLDNNGRKRAEAEKAPLGIHARKAREQPACESLRRAAIAGDTLTNGEDVGAQQIHGNGVRVAPS